jgi:hypothetical protein
MSSCILQTPIHKSNTEETSKKTKSEPLRKSLEKLRQNPRVSNKSTKGNSIRKLTQDLVTKKCGIIHEEESLDNMTLQHYVDMYFFRTCLGMYFIKRKAVHNTTAAKEELSWANHMTKAKTKEKKSNRDRPQRVDQAG